MAKHPAIFLNRDGTIIEDSGYVSDPSKIEFYPNTFDVLQNLQEYFFLSMVTIQSGVSKGLITGNAVEEVNKHIIGRLKARGTTVQCGQDHLSGI